MLVVLRRAVSTALLALAVSMSAAAQSFSGSVAGTIVDQTRQVVPGATVTLVNEQTGDRGRDVVSLLRVLPGVAYQTPTDAPGGNFGSTTPNINGTRATWNTMTVDGVVGNDLGSPQVFSSSINFDAIGEVQVELNNYRAEYGRNGGPVVNIVTKSGTSQFKGSTYWYKRHERLNANDFFNNRNGVAKPIYRFDTVGGTIGGPVLLPKMSAGRDKLFFFYSFDGLKSLNPRPLQQVTVPSALERAGDFSQSLDT